MTVRIVPATAARWDGLADLFARGVVKNCGCMWFRQSPAETKAGWDDGGNMAALEEIVCAGREPGLLAYDGEVAVGWVSVGPREDFLSRLTVSRDLKPAPGEGVWSVLCFWVRSSHRRRGLAGELLDAAVGYAREHGAAAVEGVPVEPGGRISSGSVYTGTTTMFAAAGFTEIDRRGNRPIYRLTFEP
jgi:GNAT superfamily N-acetyltransferase